MSKDRIKKLFLLSMAPVLLLAVFGFKLFDSSPTNIDGHIITDEFELAEIDLTYLNLLRKFKHRRITNRSHKSNSRLDKVLNRDPFVRPDVDLGINQSSTPQLFKESNLKMTGILWDEQSPAAIINSKIVQVGSQLGSFRVNRIQPEKVTLTSAESRVVLELSHRENLQEQFRDPDE